MAKIMNKKAYAAWSKEFNPIWITGAWLSDDDWEAGLNRMTSLGILHSHVWAIVERDSDLILEQGPSEDWIGVVVAYNQFSRFTSRGEETWDNPVIGTSVECSKCRGSGELPSGLDCKSCKGAGVKFDLLEEFGALSSKLTTLEKHFVGKARFKKEIDLVQAWEKKYKPFFYAFDDGIEDALSLLDELEVGEEHMWTMTYQYQDRTVAGVLSDYDPDAYSEGSVTLIVTENPCVERFGYMTLEMGYSCLECSGYDSDCEFCGGEEPEHVEFQSVKLSNDLEVIRKVFGN